MKKAIIIYDNIINTKGQVKEIIGHKSFGDIIHNKKTLRKILQEQLNKSFEHFEFHELKDKDDIRELLNGQQLNKKECFFVHIKSNYAIIDVEAFDHLMNKATFARKNYTVDEVHQGITIFSIKEDYRKFLNWLLDSEDDELNHGIELEVIEFEGLLDISNAQNFLDYHAYNFDSRFFNDVNCQQHNVIKSSTNKNKILSEFKFYHLLPDEMKYWFVMPYHYEENEECAKYTMERLNMFDIAIRWVHGAISEEEFKHIVNKALFFLDTRVKKATSKENYLQIQDTLFLHKVEERLEQFKALPFAKSVEDYISIGTVYKNLDELLAEYKRLYHFITKKAPKEFNLAIGHGDLCFSNMLYDDRLGLLRLIDPKGAICEENLYTNPYYDYAKLSHSICGLYDYINNDLFDLEVDSHLRLNLLIKGDHKVYTKLFRELLEQKGISYEMIRIFEASLFLSMVPLHAENEKKVLGFIINAINIIDEVKKCLVI